MTWIVEGRAFIFIWLQGVCGYRDGRDSGPGEGERRQLLPLFKTKEELLLAVLELYIQSLEPVVVQPVLGAIADPVERIFGILEFYRRNLLSTRCTWGDA